MTPAELMEIECAPDRMLGEVAQQDGYQLVRTPRFPTYYSGNGLILQRAGPSFTAWEAVHDAHFPRELYQHRTFFFDDEAAFGAMAAEASARNYHLAYVTFMHLQGPPVPQPAPKIAAELLEIRSEAEWEKMRDFDDRQDQSEDWYSPGDDALYQKDRAVTEAAKLRWFYLAGQSGEMLSKLAVYVHGSVVSLQEVVTAKPVRGQGLATALLSQIIDRYRAEGYAHFSLTADRDEDAIRIYRRLGFESVGSRGTMMTYPGIIID